MPREGATYSKGRCGICNQLISRNGLSMASHLSKHVSEGVLESKDGYHEGYCKVYKMKNASDDNWGPSGLYF